MLSPKCVSIFAYDAQDSYRTCLARAKRSLNPETLALIDADILTTLPSLHLFHPEFGAMYGDLKDVLSAWVISRRDEGLGYVHGVAKIAAMFLLNMRAPEAFLAVRNLLERHCMRSFFGGPGAKDDVGQVRTLGSEITELTFFYRSKLTTGNV